MRLLLDFLNCFFPVLSQFGFSLLSLFLLLCLELFLFQYAVCVLTDFIKAFSHILFKFLEHGLKSYFEILVLYFSYISFLRGYCDAWLPGSGGDKIS